MIISNNSTVVYSNGGYWMSGVGNYVVQLVIINRKQSTLPTMSILKSSWKLSWVVEINNKKFISCHRLQILYKIISLINCFCNDWFLK